MRVAHLRAFSEKRISLVEEKDAVDALRLCEDPVKVLLRLTDILVDNCGQVDGVKVEPQLPLKNLGGHRLASAGRPGEECCQATTA